MQENSTGKIIVQTVAYTVSGIVIVVALVLLFILVVNQMPKAAPDPPRVAAANTFNEVVQPTPAPPAQARQKRVAQPTPAPLVEPVKQPPPVQTQSLPIINQTVQVAALGFVSKQFTVTQLARVTGQFTARGGFKNNITCHIIPAADFENFKNHNSFNVYYQSEGAVTTGTIDTQLQPGQYVLIFDNRGNVLQSKTVQASVYLEY